MAEIFTDERRPVFVCVDHLDQVLAYAFCVMKETRGDAVMVDYFLSLKKRRFLWTSWPAAALGENSSFFSAPGGAPF